MPPALLLLLLQAPADRFRVQVDPRVELLCLLQRLAGLEEYNQAPDSPYRRALDAHFAPYLEHEAVTTTRSLHEVFSVSYNAPPSLAVYLKDLESMELLVPTAPLPPGLDGRWALAPVAGYLEQVRDFAEQSDFAGFLAGQAAYIAEVEAAYAAALPGAALMHWNDGFFGPRPNLRCVAVPGLLCGPNNYGVRAVDAAGQETFYQVLGVPAAAADGRLRLGTYVEPLLAHEVAHSYVNPEVERQRAAFAAAAPAVYEQVAAVMRAQAYGDWMTLCCETGVRAVTILYMQDRHGPAAGQRQAAEEEARGFAWAGEVAARWDRARAQRPFADFVPEMAAAMADWLALPPEQRRPPFRGTIHGALSAVKAGGGGSLLLAPAAGTPLAEYARAIHGKFYAAASVRLAAAGDVSPEQAAAVARVVYGTPSSNPHLAPVLAAAQAEVRADGITLGRRRFAGEHLVLILCQPSPSNPRDAIVAYAAAAEEDLVGVNSLFHGPSDWVVGRRVGAQRYEAVASGDFPKAGDGRWLPLPAAD